MFKDFTHFNSLANLLFKDEPFSLVLKAFTSFQNMLAALRTEAYDYATWYNKVMRDKYENGEPVDVTSLPYLSVPRSQLAVIRARISKVKETVQYAAQAITNVALGNKVGDVQVVSTTSTTLTPSLSANTPQTVLNAVKRIIYCVGDILISFVDGDQSVTVNGISVSISPLVRGSIMISKVRGECIGFGSDSVTTSPKRIRMNASQLIREYFKAPMVVCRSKADLNPMSSASIGVVVMNRQFFNKRLIVWIQSGSLMDWIGPNNDRHVAFFNSTLHAALVDPSAVKSTVANSLYDNQEDIARAIQFNAPTEAKFVSLNFGACQYVVNNGASLTDATAIGIIADIPSGAFSQDVPVYGSYSDVSEATTQTAIADMFYTEQEWSDLQSALIEA